MIARIWRGVVRLEAPVLYPEDARYLLGESTVTHYQVVDQVKDPSGPGQEP